MRRRQQRDPLHQKKSLSQVFLKVDWPVQRMVALLKELDVQRVIEIGPGGGVLTRAMVDAGMHVLAIEKDQRFAAHLQEQIELWESLSPGKLRVHNEDILRCDLQQFVEIAGAPCALVGNIPYHISSQIVQLAIENLSKLQVVVLMTQLEFAERVAAKPNSKDYGSLSVYAQLRSSVHLEYKVGRECFQPVPKVDSAVMTIRGRDEQLSTEVLTATEKLTRLAFSQRRKKLSNSLSTILPEGSDLNGAPVDLDRRADAIAPLDFVALVEWLSNHNP
ncbi:MAG: ribosomal RNA small subunit methyltransferase A [Deltaproteobacteria bacterium]|nr:ribosomal RNA small subunit methyltransferase A [Deltaproteobacteria bacterium]